jgi:hypothetical protein
MAIPIVCPCGERFEARDDHSSQWAFCPACGDPVAVPAVGRSRQRTGPVPAGPTGPALPPAPRSSVPIFVRLRRRHVDPNLAATAVWVPLEAEIKPTPEVKERKAARRALLRAGWTPGSFWSELLWPLRWWREVIQLGGSLGILALLTAAYLPRLDEVLAHASRNATNYVFVGAPLAVLTVLVVLWAIGFLHWVLAAALAGECAATCNTWYDWRVNLRRCAIWLLAFLAGPVLYAGVAAWFWLQIGDLNLVDFSILFELVGVITGYWLLGVIAAEEAKSLLASPSSIIALFWRLGWRGVLTVLLAPVLAYLPVRFVIGAANEMHRMPPVAVIMGIAAGVLGTFLATCYLRGIGMLVRRTRGAANGTGG